MAIRAAKRRGKKRARVPPIQHARTGQGPGRVEARLHGVELAPNGENDVRVSPERGGHFKQFRPRPSHSLVGRRAKPKAVAMPDASASPLSAQNSSAAQTPRQMPIDDTDESSDWLSAESVAKLLNVSSARVKQLAKVELTRFRGHL